MNARHVMRTYVSTPMVCLLALWQICQPLHGATVFWDGDADGQWATAANWSGNLAPVAGDLLTFTGALNTSTTNDFTAGTSFAGLTFDNTSTNGAFTLAGNAITLGGDITTTGSTGTPTHTISLDLALDATRTITTALNNNLAITGVISGTGFGIAKEGTGTLTLSGANTFTGTLTLNAGTLRAQGNAAALGAGTLQLNGGTLYLANDANLNFGRAVTVGGDVTITADRLTSAATSTTFTLGPLTIGAHTLTTTRGANITSTSTGNVTFSGGTTLTGNAIFAPQTRDTVNLGTVNDGGNGFTLTAAGSGTGATVTLTGAGAWSGGTIVNSGTLRVDSSDGLGANGLNALNPTVTTVNGGVLRLGNANTARNNRLIDFQGNATLFLVNTNATTWNIGQWSHSAGNLTLSTAKATSGGTPVNHTLNKDIALNGNLTLTTTVDVNFLYGGVISEASGTRNLSKTGAGMVRLGAVSTYSGTTTITNGELRLNVANALPSGAGKGDLTFNPASGTTATLNLNGYSQTLNGISSSGAGTSVIDNAGVDAVTLTIGANDGAGTFSGTIQNTGGALTLVKTGGGQIILNGTVSQTGATEVNGGVLSVAPAALASTSGVSVGTTGHAQLDLFADNAASVWTAGYSVTLGGAATLGGLGFQLGANTASSDQLVFTGAGALTVGAAGGLISAVALSGFGVGSYDVISGPNAITGTAGLQLGSLPGGFTYGLDTSVSGVVTLNVSAASGGDLFWTGDSGDSWAALLGGNSNWSTTADGLTEAGFTPGAANMVRFSAANAGAGAINTTLDNAYSIAGLQILNSGTGAVSITPGFYGTLTIGAGGIDIQTGAPALTTISAPVVLGAGQAWTVPGTRLLDVSGSVSGAGDLSVSGGGTVNLSGINTFTGNVVVDGAGSTLAFNSAEALNLGATGAQSYTVQNGAAFSLTGAVTVNPTAGSNTSFIIGSGGGILDVADAGGILRLDDAGQFSGTGVLTKSGAGILWLGSSSVGHTNFTGGQVNVVGGELRLAGNEAIGAAGSQANIALEAGGTLHLHRTASTTFGSNVSVNGDSSIITNRASAGTTAYTHTLGVLSIGGQKLTVVAGDLITGGTMILAFGNANLSGAAVFESNNNGLGATTQLTLGAVDVSTHGFTVQGSGNVRLNGLNGSQTIIKRGEGRLITGVALPDFAGDFHVVEGMLTSAGTVDTPFGTGVIYLGDEVANTADAAWVGLTANVVANQVVLRSGSTGTLFVGTSNTGSSMLFSGTITGNNHLSVGLTSTGPSLEFSALVNPAGTLTIASTGTRTGGSPSSVIFSGGVGSNVTGIIHNTDKSVTTLSGTNEFSGQLSVLAGSLTISGALSNPGMITTLNVAGGGALDLRNGVGSPLNALTSLSLGTGTGIAVIGLDVGTVSDAFTLTTGAATTANQVVFHVNAVAGFDVGTFDLVSAAGGGLSGASYSLGSAPGGFIYGPVVISDTLAQLNVLSVLSGDIFWRGELGGSWGAFSSGQTNWTTDLAGLTDVLATPGGQSTVIFSADGAAGPSIATTLDRAFTINDLRFNANPGGITDITIAAGNGGSLTLAPVSSADGISITANAGAITISAPVSLGANQTWTVDGTGASLLVSGVISGTGGLVKAGTGVLTVSSAASTYAGSTTIQAGTLQAAVTNGFNNTSAHVIAAGGTLQLNNFSTTVGSIAGAGTIENGGTAGRTLTTGGDNSSTVFSGILQNGGTGALGLTKMGTGMLTLSGSSSTATGNMIVSGGILAITGTMNNGTGDTDAGVADNTSGMIYVPTGGSLSTELISLGNGVTNRAGTLVIRGGAVALTTTSTSSGLDAGNGGYGGVMIESGSLTLNRLDSSALGSGASVIRVNGGTLTSNEYLILRNRNSEFTITAGQVLHNTASQNIALSYQSAGTTVMTVAGGTVDNSGRDVTFGQASTDNAGYVGVLNLTGGNLITNRIVSTVRGASLTTVNFNGGTLTAATEAADFFNAATNLTAFVHAGGVSIHTAGNNVTLGVALQAPTGNGLTGMTVSNAGGGYIGAPYVEITGDGTGATGYAVVDLDPASVDFGKVTGVVVTNPGSGYTTATVNLLGGGGAGAVIDTPVFGANASGGLTKTGAGTLTLTGLNTYTGGTSITGGTLALGANDALAGSGAVSISNAASFDLGSFSNTVGQVTLTDGSITGTTGVLSSTAAYDLRNGTVSAILGGSVGINKTTAGTVALSGANTFSGTVSVTGGTLAFTAADQLGDASVTNTLFVDDATLSFTGIATANLAANQVLSIGAGGATLNTAFGAGTLGLTGGIVTSGAANLTKTGVGTVTVSGTTNLNGGNVTVSEGVLNAGFTSGGIGSITVAGGAALNLYDGSAVTVNVSALSLAGGSALGFDLGASGTNDVVALTGTPTLSGTISLNFNDIGGLGVGSYDLITASGGSLNTASYVLGIAPSGLNYSFSTVSGNSILRLTTSNLTLRYWRGDVDGSWSTNNAGDTNWSTNSAGTIDLAGLPGANEALVFSATSATGPVIVTTLDGNFGVDSLQFTANPAGVTAVTVNQGSSGTLTVAPASGNNGISIADNAGVVTLNAPLVAGAAQTWEVVGTGANGSALVINGQVSFNSAVTKTGEGVLTLTGDNTGAGGLTINAGTLQIGSSTAVGAGALTFSPGITVDNSSGAALTLANNNVLAWDGSFTFTGTHDLNFGTGAVSLGNNLVANIAAGTLTVGGVMDDSVNAYTVTKSGVGTLVLNGANTHDGGLTLSVGTLHLGHASALGSGVFTVGAGTTFDNTTGAPLTLAGANAQVWQGGFTFTGTHDLNLGVGAVLVEQATTITTTSGVLTVGGVIDDGVNAFALAKAGLGTLALTGQSTYSGATQIDQGTLRIGVDNALPTGTTLRLGTGGSAGTLDLTNFSQAIAGLSVESTTDTVTNQILIGAAQALTINGAVLIGGDAVNSSTRLTVSGAGSLVINSGGASFQVGGSTLTTNLNAATADFSGLQNLSMDLGNGTFRIGDAASAITTGLPTSTVLLAVNSTITAAVIRVGDGTPPQNTTAPHTLTLGSGANILNANVIAVGSGQNSNLARSSGRIIFAAGDSTGTLQIRGSDGVGRATLHMVNSTSTTGNSISSVIDFSGHTVDVLVSALNMARRTQGAGAATATLTFDQGSFDVNTLVMAHRVTTGTGDSTATLNIGDSAAPGTSVFTVNSTSTLALATGDTAGSDATATINITGGNVIFGGAINMANAVTGQIATANINITGGTVTLGTGNITRTGGAGTENATITLNGGVLDMNSRNIGTAANQITFLAQSGTLRNLNQLNGGGVLEKTTSGTLVLDTANSHTGVTTVSAGILSISNGGALGTTAGGTVVGEGGTLLLSNDITVTGEALSLTAGAGGSAVLSNLSGSNVWTGNLTVNTGEDASNRAVLNSEAGNLLISGAVNLSAGTQDFILRGEGDGEISGQITGSQRLFKSSVGTGTWILSGDNSATFTGRATVGNGTLQVSAEANLGAVPGDFAANHLTLGGGSTTGRLRTTATMALSANRGVTIAAGGGAFETAAGTTLTVESVITGGGALSKEGAGTLIFNAVNTNTGTTTVNAGVLGGSGSVGGNLLVADGGTLAPGNSAGMFTVSGDLTVSSGGTLLMELGGGTFNAAAAVQAEMNANGNLSGLAGSIPPEWENYQVGVTGHDHILVNGASAPVIDGTLRFGPLLGAYNPVYGDVFDLLDWSFAGNISGATSFDFSAVTLDAGLGFNTDLFASNGLIVVVPEPSRALFLMLGLLGLMLRRRRR